MTALALVLLLYAKTEKECVRPLPWPTSERVMILIADDGEDETACSDDDLDDPYAVWEI